VDLLAGLFLLHRQTLVLFHCSSSGPLDAAEAGLGRTGGAGVGEHGQLCRTPREGLDASHCRSSVCSGGKRAGGGRAGPGGGCPLHTGLGIHSLIVKVKGL
jgi:hypothetical protein